MDLATSLRTAIAFTHTAIEETPFSKSMIDGSIDRDSYIELLRQLLAIHQPLEQRLAASSECASLYRSSMARSETLRRDIEALGGDSDIMQMADTRSIIEHIETCPATALLGILYVFEGSRMGSMILGRSLARAFQLPAQLGHGLDYHLDGIATRPRDWQQFRGAINQLALNTTESDEMVTAAVRTMEVLTGLYTALSHETTTV